MSILGHRVSSKTIAALAALMVLVALLPAMSSQSVQQEQVTLVARGMAFYLEGDAHHPNPTVEVRAGEHLRIVLRNQDPGMTHDFAVPVLDAAMRPIQWNESADVVIDVPTTPGTYEYICRPHRLMMRGTIRVY